jgi:hypothetical protein
MVHLDSYGFQGKHSPIKVDQSNFHAEYFQDSSHYLKDVSYWITFLSANVFRRDAEIIEFRIEDHVGGLFAFLAFYLGVLIRRQRHARLRGPMFARREDNGIGGYKLYKTFTVDLNRMFRAGIAHGLDSSAVDVVNAALLTSFLPSFTLKLKAAAGRKGKIELGPIRPLIACCWKYPELWLITVPVRMLPASLGGMYWVMSSKGCVIFRRLRAA